MESWTKVCQCMVKFTRDVVRLTTLSNQAKETAPSFSVSGVEFKKRCKEIEDQLDADKKEILRKISKKSFCEGKLREENSEMFDYEAKRLAETLQKLGEAAGAEDLDAAQSILAQKRNEMSRCWYKERIHRSDHGTISDMVVIPQSREVKLAYQITIKCQKPNNRIHHLHCTIDEQCTVKSIGNDRDAGIFVCFNKAYKFKTNKNATECAENEIRIEADGHVLYFKEIHHESSKYPTFEVAKSWSRHTYRFDRDYEAFIFMLASLQQMIDSRAYG